MKSQTFDGIARRLPLATSRRGIARIGSGAPGAAVLVRFGLASSEGVAAKAGKCTKPCGECERCDPGTCRKNKHGTKRCRRGTCTPKADFTSCSFGCCFDGDCTPT